jgi:hypothetical protein
VRGEAASGFAPQSASANTDRARHGDTCELLREALHQPTDQRQLAIHVDEWDATAMMSPE